MGFVAGCIDPAMVILLVVKLSILDFFLLPLHVHCKELDRMLFQTSHVYRLADIRSDQGVSCD